jgi:hypothetical protein
MGNAGKWELRISGEAPWDIVRPGRSVREREPRCLFGASAIVIGRSVVATFDYVEARSPPVVEIVAVSRQNVVRARNSQCLTVKTALESLNEAFWRRNQQGQGRGIRH